MPATVRLSLPLVALAFGLVSLPVAPRAADGVLEINQACAFVGCFPGDDPGFPVTITAGGSYRLTSNLLVNIARGTVDETRIEIRADDVTLDLNGFEIGCSSTVPGSLGTCPGQASGVRSFVRTEFAGRGVTVQNGVVRGWPQIGVVVIGYSVVRNVTALSNGTDGIVASDGSRVERCTAAENGENGIEVNDSRVANSVALRNGEDGVSASGSLVESNWVHDNGAFGIVASRSRVSRNAAIDNQGGGLNLSANEFASGFDHNTITGSNPVAGGHDAGGNSCNGGPC